MSAKLKAVDDIKKLGRMLSGIMEVATELEQMGSIEQAMSEAKVRMANLKDEEAKVQARHSQYEIEFEAIKREADEALDEAHANAEIIVQAAQEKAVAICDAAKVEAKELIKASLTEQDKIMADTFKAKQDLSEVKAELEVKSKDLNELNAQMAAIRQKVN